MLVDIFYLYGQREVVIKVEVYTTSDMSQVVQILKF
jgi:hypothetical protein